LYLVRSKTGEKESLAQRFALKKKTLKIQTTYLAFGAVKAIVAIKV
jgi:hypothetical protein